MILTKEEIQDIIEPHQPDSFSAYRAVEQAVIAKLSQGAEPVGLIDGNNEKVHFRDDTMYYYWIGRNSTPLYLESSIAASRVKALEDAAVLCEELLKCSGNDYEYVACEEAATKIRALKGANHD